MGILFPFKTTLEGNFHPNSFIKDGEKYMMGVFQSLLGFPFTPCSFMEIASRGWMGLSSGAGDGGRGTKAMSGKGQR